MIYPWSEKQWSVQVETLYHTISLGVKTGQKFTSVTADMQDRIIPTLQLINCSCFVHNGQLARVPFLPLKQTAQSCWLCDLLMGEPFQPTGLSPAFPALPDKRLMKPISWLVWWKYGGCCKNSHTWTLPLACAFVSSLSLCCSLCVFKFNKCTVGPSACLCGTVCPQKHMLLNYCESFGEASTKQFKNLIPELWLSC